jgi:outer membrane receptor for ferrienterochelin and colicins
MVASIERLCFYSTSQFLGFVDRYISYSSNAGNLSKLRLFTVFLCFLFGVAIQPLQAQKWTKAKVWYDSASQLKPATGVSIYILPSGDTTISDTEGQFKFRHLGTAEDKSILVFQYGDSYRDTLVYIPEQHIPEFTLARTISATGKSIEKAVVRGGKVASRISSRGIQKVEILNEGEFKKAACCTLSESFETNNTVEVSNADGVSGIRQVEMLGLAGKYVLMTRDNIPVIRGLNVLTGLNQIPGPMVSGVHIAKGAGSVTNGYEGITGGINYALRSEPNDPRLFLNGYINGQGRAEGNLVVKSRLNKNTFHHTYLHYGNQYKAHDKGGDGYTDIPLFQRIYAGNQLKYYGKKSEGQFGFNYTRENREGGDIHNFHDVSTTQLKFQFNMLEERAEAFAKLGIFLEESGERSIGNIFSISRTKSNALLNNMIGRRYEGTQDNLIFTSLYGTPDDEKWSLKTGINTVVDKVHEVFQEVSDSISHYNRLEWSTGAFFELVRKTEKSSLVLGNRLDYNNLFGWLYTPRIHYKYEFSEVQQFHLQAGIGRRSPWIFAENIPLLINNRDVVIEGQQTQTQFPGVYGFKQEKAINVGGSYTYRFMAFEFPATWSTDIFYSYFFNQLVVDRDMAPNAIRMSAQAGNQTALAQTDVELKPHRRMDVKLSYRYVYSIQNTGGKMQIQSLQSPHRGLAVFNYNTRSKWYFDGIVQINSPRRMPNTEVLEQQDERFQRSPWYSIINAQIRKDYKNWEFYTGLENILNVRQNNPVLEANYNGAPIFDAAFAWGPVMGRNIYAGFRLKIN